MKGAPIFPHSIDGKVRVPQYIHAEMTAYKKAKGLLNKKKFSCVNIRLGKDAETKLSKPCHCCISWLCNVGCVEVWYSVKEDKWEKLSF